MLRQFIHDNQNADVAQLALQRNRYPMLSDSDFRFALQQIEGRQRTRDKLPTFAAIDGWLYPPRLNLEQCSSERTARFKASLLSSLISQLSTLNAQPSTPLNPQLSTLNLIDATGGYGVDTFFMSEQAAQTHYFEQNADLAAIAEHNFRLAGKTIHCHPAPFTLQSLSTFDFRLPTIIYLDPARRDSHGGKVVRLEDCTPNVIDIIRQIRAIRTEPQIRVLLKLSPMLDFHQAVRQLGGAWDVYAVSVNGEMKELLLLSEGSGKVNAVMLSDDSEQVFTFTPDEESRAEVQFLPANMSLAGMFVYEPDAALLKAGAFRLISARYRLMKAALNTHLYFADTNQTFDCKGRTWQIMAVYTRVKDVQRALACAGVTHINVLARNYVLPADTLRKQFRLKDGGDDYIIGCRAGEASAGQPILLHCKRVENVQG